MGQLALGSIEGRSGSHDAELTTGQIIYTQQQKAVIIIYKNKRKQKTVSHRHKEDVREASLAAVCKPARVVSLQLQNRKYTMRSDMISSILLRLPRNKQIHISSCLKSFHLSDIRPIVRLSR